MEPNDLDARLAAAQSEVTGEPHRLKIKGDEYLLPPQLDALAVADACRYEGLEVSARLVEALFGRAQYERLLTLHLNDEQLSIVMTEAAALYGLKLGESRASVRSSENGSRSSRPTSRARTTST